MPDIGFGEILVIAVIALLVFGPDRLPKVAADAARTLRQVRQMAANARRDLVDASGIHDDDEISQAVRDLRDLDPRRAMKPEPAPRQAKRTMPGGPAAAATPLGGTSRSSGGPSGNGSGPAAGSSSSTSGSEPSRGDGAQDANGAPRPEPGTARPVAPPVLDAAPADPDWT